MVIGDQKDIQEVKNAYEAYEQIDKVNPYSVEDLKKIHGILTFLVEKMQENLEIMGKLFMMGMLRFLWHHHID